MRTAQILQLLLMTVVVCIAAMAQQKDTVPVVVELFTAEGCPSCPPADELLAALARTDGNHKVEIIVIIGTTQDG